MPPSSVAARSFALAVIGVGAASFAAHGQSLTAFNPYSGAGLPSVSGNGDPDSRKVSLARALIVRNYLIDKGVRSRIEIASIVGSGGKRVKTLVAGT